MQLSHHLSAHLNWHSAAETLVMMLAVLTVWAHTSWTATVIRSPGARPNVMLLAVMGLGLLMNVAIGHAFDSMPWGFVIPMLLIEIGRTLWTLHYAPDAAYREHYRRALVWILATAPIWIIGALVEPEARLHWWAAAALIELAGTWLAHPLPGRALRSEHMPFNAPLFLERCSLFLLIALGETILTTGLSLTEVGLTLNSITTGLLAFVGTIALWAIIFGASRQLSIWHLQKATDTVRVGRFAMNAIYIMTTGLVVLAVANRMVITGASGLERINAGYSLLLITGPVLFVLGHAVYLRVLPEFNLLPHGIALLVLVALGVASQFIPPLWAHALVMIWLVMLAIADQVFFQRLVANKDVAGIAVSNQDGRSPSPLGRGG
ncbi:MAG: low temperature requirement protein A [Thiolinea sp.]